MPPDIRLDRADDPVKHMRQRQPRPLVQPRIGIEKEVGDRRCETRLGTHARLLGARNGIHARWSGVTPGVLADRHAVFSSLLSLRAS